MEAMPDSFAIASPVYGDDGSVVDFRWEYVNDAYCTLMGFDRETLLQQRGSELFPDFRGSERFACYRRAAITGERSRIHAVFSFSLPPGAGARVIENNVVGVGGRVAVLRACRHRARASRGAARSQ